jgi:CheY-like chemotaxis protein/anti-sigma regulatory factor (Ser/Thr protein kinase)/HPt (histidine-containing phosphotransfer) domain-containing protein
MQLRQKELAPQNRIELEKIYSSGNTLLGVINDVLDMSKIEKVKLEINNFEYDVPSFICDSVQNNIVQLGSKEIDFILEVDENLPSTLIGDELRLRQIVNNIFSNAIKYTEKGYIKFIINHTVKDDYIILNLTIEDTGQGMKKEDKELLFTEYKRFNTSQNLKIEGIGLGLNITKNLVDLMDGEIEVESIYGKGSIFKVTVKQQPVPCEVIGKELAQGLQNFTFSGNKQLANINIAYEPMPYGKVLAVDDVESNLYVIRGLLLAYQIETETVLSGAEAIEKVKSGENYDIIFMDHMMPGMDGIETTNILRKLGCKDIIVALTANALAGNAEMFKNNGFDDFISKPIDVRLLDNALKKYISDKYKHSDKNVEIPKIHEPLNMKAISIDPELLMLALQDIENSIALLKESLKNNDIKLFTTTVHAIKSAFTNIGETENSELAALLEKAGHDGDNEFIFENADDFIEKIENFISK